MSLRRRVIEAGAWTVTGHGAELVMRLISSLIMTRLLLPEAFGLMAIVSTIPIALALLTDLGIRAVIIRSDNGEDADFLHTAWTVQWIRGLLIWIAVIGAAIVLSIAADHDWLRADSAFADPLLPSVLVVSSFGVVLLSFEATNLHVRARRMNFKPLILLGLGSRLVAFPVMILWALYDRSVWALVAGQLAGALVHLIASHILISGPKMRLAWNREHVRQILHYGKWVALSTAATFVSNQSDRLVMGALLPSGVIGLYAIAYLLIEALEGVLRRLGSSITMPMFGEILRTQPKTLAEKYYRFRAPIDAAAFLIAGTLAVAGSAVIEFLYDDRYLGAGWMVQILAWSMVAFPFDLIASAFSALGEPWKYAAASVIRGITLLAAIGIGYAALGIEGIVIGVALHRVPAALFIMTLAYQKGWIRPLMELRFLPLVGVGMLIGQCGVWIGRGLGLIS